VTGYACPGCGETMQRKSFERRPVGNVEIDLCFPCQSIWFDQYESTALAPGGVLDLFREIHENAVAPRPPGASPRCPVCRKLLQPTQDLQRTSRITYMRCVESHGRFTSFFQFLREKDFVRTLTLLEVTRLQVHVTQVRCSSCGAPVDLVHDAQCSFCHAPISILDADAVRRTIAELTEQERQRKPVDPAAAVDALLAGKRFERKMDRIEGRGMVDLVGEALDFLMNDARPRS
jgi:Transcription factor zinc-finger